MSSVSFSHVTKRYPDGTLAVDALELDIADGEFMVLVGPSGCGKSTALRMVAGLEEVSEGDLLIAGERVNDLSPRARNIAMVFQNYALYPHMTVRENMGFALDVARVPKAEIDTKVRAAADILGLTEHLDRRPKALSGGQRQRVAMGRAIVREPSVFLMDEPLSNLDAKLRVQMRSDIIRLQDRLGTTTLYVTHDQVEAMTMADRVAVMRKGLLQQVASPEVLYDDPANLFVAGFIGSPSMNMLDAVIDERDGELWAVLGDRRVRIDPAAVARHPHLRERVGSHVVMGARPEFFLPVDASELPDSQRLSVVVEIAESMGSEVHTHFALPIRPLDTDVVAELAEGHEDDHLRSGDDVTMVIAKLDGKHRVSSGQVLELALDTARCHFFDIASGLPLR